MTAERVIAASAPGAQGSSEVTAWYGDWQHPAHVERFDARSRLDARNLIRNYEAFNDVRLLKERLDPARSVDLVEVGCATGEFSRYLRLAFPQVRYAGLDVSEPAIARAKAKYPETPFFVVDAGRPVAEGLARLGLSQDPALIYSKDVMQHQLEPLAFLSDLIRRASEAVIVRCRTRDVGPTERDPERSCQHHYGGWMPYIVVNLQELLDRIVGELPDSEVVVYRHHMVLGGRHERFLPKELYLEETGTAETAVGIFKTSDRTGRVVIQDRSDGEFIGTWDYRLKLSARKALTRLRSHAAGAATSSA